MTKNSITGLILSSTMIGVLYFIMQYGFTIENKALIIVKYSLLGLFFLGEMIGLISYALTREERY